MFAQVKALRYWKSEHYDLSTCEDACNYNVARGLFAVSDGAGTTSFSDIWARILVKHFVDIPLTAEDPFEVEWWTRLAQKEYTAKVPPSEMLPWPAQQKAREGSQATLVTMRITHVDSYSVQAELLAFGDSCIFIRSAKEPNQLKSFPLKYVSDFDAPPICVPSLARVFNRYYHKCKIIPIDLYPDDTLILATDAVAKWILSRGAQGFQTILEQNDDMWPAFIKTCRTNGEMVDDDSTAVIVKLSIQQGSGLELHATHPHSVQVIQERKQAFEEAYTSGSIDMAAIYYGDGVDLGELVPQKEIERARKVADALHDMIQAIRNNINDVHFATKVGPIWEKHKGLLLEESCAKNIRETLEQKGVNVIGTLVTPPPPASVGASQPHDSSSKEGVNGEKVVALETTSVSSPLRDEAREPAYDTLEQEQQKRTVVAPPRSPAYAPLEAHGELVGVDILAELEKAFQGRNDGQFKQILAQVRKKLERANIASRFIIAYFSEDDENIVKEYDALQMQGLHLTTNMDRIVLARRRKVAKDKWKLAQDTRRAQEIVRDYEEMLDGSSLVSEEERRQLELAREVVKAYESKNDDAIVAARAKIDEYDLKSFLKFTSEEDKRYNLAIQRRNALRHFREMLKTGRFTLIVDAYKPILDGHSQITAEEWEKLRLAILLFDSYTKRDYERLVDAYEDATAFNFFKFTEDEEKLYEEALHELAESPKPSMRVALVNGQPVTFETFRKVYMLRRSYLLYKSSVKKEIKKATRDKQSASEIVTEIDRLDEEALQETTLFRERTLEELINDAILQAFTQSLPIDVNREVESELSSEARNFAVHYGNNFDPFLRGCQLSKKDVEDVLRIFIRRQRMEKYYKEQVLSLDSWLENGKRHVPIRRSPERIKLVNPPPDLQEPEQKRRLFEFLRD